MQGLSLEYVLLGLLRWFGVALPFGLMTNGTHDRSTALNRSNALNRSTVIDKNTALNKNSAFSRRSALNRMNTLSQCGDRSMVSFTDITNYLGSHIQPLNFSFGYESTTFLSSRCRIFDGADHTIYR